MLYLCIVKTNNSTTMAQYLLKQDNGQETMFNNYNDAKEALKQVVLTKGNFAAHVFKMHEDGNGTLKCYKNHEGIHHTGR